MNPLRYRWYRFLWWYAAAARWVRRVPLHVDIELSKVCNLRCIMCPFGDDKWEAPQGQMDSALALRAALEIKRIGVFAMKPNFRGEPLMSKELMSVLRVVRGLDVLINTNLLPATQGRIRELAALASTVIVSIDGATRQTYERIRINGSWERLLRNLSWLYKAGARVKIQLTLQRDNEHEVDAFLHRFPGAEIKPATNRVGDGTLMCGALRAVGRRPCPQPYQRLVIGYDGTAYGCCSNWNDEFPVGKYPQESIKDLWHGPRMRLLRRFADDPTVPMIDGVASPCVKCDVGSSYIWERISPA